MSLDPNTQTQVQEQFKVHALDALQKISTELNSNYSAGKDFVLEQAPQLVHEIVTWGIARNAIWSLFWFAIFSIISVMIYKLIYELKKSPKTDESIDEAIFKFSLILIGINLFCFLRGLDWFLDSLKIYLAPRLYIIEQSINIAKGNF